MEILTEKDLLSAVEEGTFIQGGRPESCEGIKYDFTLSNIVLTVDSKGPIDIEQSKENIMIKPGEIAFVMTKEALSLPNDIYCQLSTKRKLSLDGIVTLGGLIIDPNYKGKLFFGLYNISSRDYLLRPGKKLIAGVFYKGNYKSDKQPKPINDFPDELIKMVVDNKPNSTSSILTTIERLGEEIKYIKEKLDNDEKWKVNFQNGLTEIQQLVHEMGENLSTEIKTRANENLEIKNEQLKLKESLMPMPLLQKRFQFFNVALVTLIITVAGSVIAYIITQFFNK
ncbi:MAG: hypothetical protein LBQ93_06910 [Treponema sp.]|jgi:dUTPase|nr:hypothetical protein [Treponema sp.]